MEFLNLCGLNPMVFLEENANDRKEAREEGRKGRLAPGKRRVSLPVAYVGRSGRNADVNIETVSFILVSDSSLLSKGSIVTRCCLQSLPILTFFGTCKQFFSKENYNKMPVSIWTNFNHLKTCLFSSLLPFDLGHLWHRPNT